MVEHQIGQSIEVYIDDMLVKSLRVEDYLTHLQESFDILRSYNMKLNPEKCAFGVGSGKFLVFMVLNRGIEISPDKIKDIEEITMVNNVKAVQRLTERIAALGRFISRSSDRSHHFFSLLKKKNSFEWTPEFQHALEELKRYLSSPPLLYTTKEDEMLYLYLTVSEVAVSGMLVREEQGTQFPVYYVSRTLGDAENRLAKWVIDLGGYDIECQPRTAIKSQILADFVANFMPALMPEAERELLLRTGTSLGVWTLFTDGASNVNGSGLGIVLKLPMGGMIRQSIKTLNFTNNEADYEAIIAVLELAKSLGAEVVEVKCDSLLDESTKKTIIQKLKRRLENAKGKWREVFPEVLRAYRKTGKSSIGETPFSLVYGSEALIPVEVEEPSTRFRHATEDSNSEAMTVALDLLDEKREAALV
ncbi:PREDICTED: uncharacterized protein LOC109206901 [Nicotiana attenuata]|uniref:uncharacterized protein LOC109206901 n=1 Tax=Nicotiana attenuata TaxID=49451 RepID=UPI0009050C0F|nr:PREDICTED: uncharacterized protein LOC109206901 [Nicotiana attenuata]